MALVKFTLKRNGDGEGDDFVKKGLVMLSNAVKRSNYPFLEENDNMNKQASNRSTWSFIYLASCDLREYA